MFVTVFCRFVESSQGAFVVAFDALSMFARFVSRHAVGFQRSSQHRVTLL